LMSSDPYFPVPTIRRDANSLPPITRDVSMAILLLPCSATHRPNHLDAVAVLEPDGLELMAARDLAVHGDLHRPSGGPKNKTTAPTKRVRPCRRRVPFAGITQIRFEGSRAAPGSQESSPHDDDRSIPPSVIARRPHLRCCRVTGEWLR